MKITAPVTFNNMDALAKRIDSFDRQANRQILGVLRYTSREMVKQMKKQPKDGGAPWNDDSGDARRGLHATDIEHVSRVADRVTEFKFYLAHSVEYGWHLETRHMGTGRYGFGKYSIIMPTITEFGPVIMDRISQQIANIRAGPGEITWAFDPNQQVDLG